MKMQVRESELNRSTRYSRRTSIYTARDDSVDDDDQVAYSHTQEEWQSTETFQNHLENLLLFGKPSSICLYFSLNFFILSAPYHDEDRRVMLDTQLILHCTIKKITSKMQENFIIEVSYSFH